MNIKLLNDQELEGIVGGAIVGNRNLLIEVDSTMYEKLTEASINGAPLILFGTFNQDGSSSPVQVSASPA